MTLSNCLTFFHFKNEDGNEEVEAGMLHPGTEQHEIANEERRQKIEQKDLRRKNHM